MNDWFRSLTVLGAAFAVVVATTLGLSVVIVPGAAISSQVPDAASPEVGASVAPPDGIAPLPTRVGGTLVMSGDRQDSFTVNRESTDGRYGLIGDKGRIFFGGDPLSVVQMNADGLSFFPEPEECTITPGELDAAIGVAAADLTCIDVADVRGNGVVTIEGTVRLAADVLGMRDHLPPSGGTVAAGDETWVFENAVLFTGPASFFSEGVAHNMSLFDRETGTELGIAYDFRTHRVSLVLVRRDLRSAVVAEDDCSISTREIGVVNPRTTLVELSLECAEIDVPDLGPVPIAGTIVIELVEPPR